MSELDLRAVVAEIYDDVQRRRRSGEYPPGLERELDHLFALHAPPAAVGDDMAVLLDRAERASFIDVDVPTTSNRPAVPYAKRGLRKAMAWYLRYVTQQVSALGGVLVRALTVLDKRVSRLEAAVPATSERVVEELRTYDVAPLAEAWRELAVDRIVASKPTGRVLHAECGDGAIVAALAAGGVDAYGIDARRALLGDALKAGLDVRPDDALDHLRLAGPGSLGGLVLSGVVERTTASASIELADRAAEVLVPGSVIVVISATPEAWETGLGPVAADLAAGRPLRAATWQHLLEVRGFTTIEVVEGDRLAGALTPVPDDAPAAAVMNANLAALNDRLFPPASYAVIARLATDRT